MNQNGPMYFILTLEDSPTEKHYTDIWKQANRGCENCRYEGQSSITSA